MKKPRTSTVILSITTVLFAWLYGATYTNVTLAQTNQAHATDCWNRGSTLAATAIDVYNTTITYNNAGYQLDDYTTGSVNTKVDAYNSAVNDYNSVCAGRAPQLQTN